MVCESIAKREYFVHDAAMHFSDPDTSGGPPRRVGYNALLAAAFRREFDVVVAEDISRLWRNKEMQTRDINELLELPARKTGEIEIDPEQAKVVRQIFECRLAGWSGRRIAQELNEQETHN